MDCRRCIHIRYSGCRHGRCSHPGHKDVVLRPGSGYNTQICGDFVFRRRCSNCAHWLRGEYFGDGITPALGGGCSMGMAPDEAGFCMKWKKNRMTSWKKSARRK